MKKKLAALEIAWACGVCLLPLAVWIIDGRSVLAVSVATYQAYLFVPSLLLALWGLLTKRAFRHRASIIASLFFIVAHGIQWSPARAWPSSNADELVVMTFNVQLAWSQPEKEREVVLRANPDLLAIQEIGRRSEGLLALLEKEGYACDSCSYSPKGGGPGLALCVRRPLEIVKLQRRTYHAKGRWPYLFAEVRRGESLFNVIVPHLLAFGISHVDPLRETGDVLGRIREASRWHRQEAIALTDLLSRLADPTIVAGDFNSTPDQALHGQLRRHLKDAFREAGFGFGATYRYLLPLRIDYVYVTPEIDVLDARVVGRGASDHHALVAKIRLP